MNTYYLSLGSNIGDRIYYLETAQQQLQQKIGLITTCSPIYETPAWGNTNQANFYNLALSINTHLYPLEFLAICQDIENDLGRQRTEHWGARTLDIDIIAIDQQIIIHPDLKIPHPYMQDRKFVLQPLLDIVPDWTHPILKKNLRKLLEICPDKSEITALSESNTIKLFLNI